MGSEAMKWADLTTGDLDALSRDTPVILNIAAIEQHGPHLPVDTDLRIGGFFLDQLDQEMPDAQLILPPVCVGCSDHHLDFTGTLSIPHQVFQDYVIAGGYLGSSALCPTLWDQSAQKHTPPTRFKFLSASNMLLPDPIRQCWKSAPEA